MKKVTQIFLLLPVIAIMGCSTYEFSQKTTYENQPPLQIPPGLSQAKMQEAYPLPAGVGEGGMDNPSGPLLPPGSQIAEYKGKKGKKEK